MLDLSHTFTGQAQLATDRHEGFPVRPLLQDLALPGLEERHGKPQCVKLGMLVKIGVGLMPVDDLPIQPELRVTIAINHGSGQAQHHAGSVGGIDEALRTCRLWLLEVPRNVDELIPFLDLV